MKLIAKITIIVAMAIIPTFSQAQENIDKWKKLADEGFITKEQAAIAIDKETVENWEMQQLRMEQEYQASIRDYNRKLIREFIPVVCTIILSVFAVIILIILFRNQRLKDKEKKEIIHKLIDKDVFTQAQPANLEFLIKEKSTITTKNFITDATFIGLGLGLLSCHMNDLFDFCGNILFWLGIARIIIRSITAIAIVIVDRKEVKKTPFTPIEKNIGEEKK